MDTTCWQKLKGLVDTANTLMAAIGEEETNNFNTFRDHVNDTLKAKKIKLNASEKNAILNAVSWYDETAEKVIGKQIKFKSGQLETLLEHLSCTEEQLQDFGYYSQDDGRYLTYESSSDLRDSESVSLKDEIHRYFLAEVKPHVEEAWINLDSVKIGCEISFNKYFYRYKPLRSLEEVTKDLMSLEQEAEGLIAEILKV